MLGNLKDFLSVVQEGLTSNNNLRQTLQEVQKVTGIFKEKQKVATEDKVNYGTGGALLEKYQDAWVEIHGNADSNSKAADEVDKLILELHQETSSRLKSAHDLAQGLSHIPALTAAVAECMDSMKTLQALMKTVEEELVEFEDIVEKSKQENWKLDHQYHLTLYKEKKMASLEEVRNKLARENTEKSIEKEKQQIANLQVKREDSEMAFKYDVAKYLANGNLPTVPKPVSSKVTLEQIQLDEDKTDLEKFLDS
uniref:Dysbindin-like protein n=1 Tax=Bombyx mori TaxID=7091 RepID=I7GVK6_BOMMO|nr:dysbindin-like protein [Bombyx mori]